MTERVLNAVIFDIGGVLIDCNPRYFYAQHFSNRGDMEYFLAHVCNDEWNRQQDRGRDVGLAMRELAEAHPQYATLINMFYSHFNQMIRGVVSGMTALLQELLTARVPLYGLTNWPDATFHHAVERLPLLAQFRGILTSASVGLLKPDPAIYKLAMARFGVDGERTLFVDDHWPNVLGARTAGLRAARFADAPTLRLLLAKNGVLA